MNFQKIEGLRKGSVNYVYEGYLFIKNKADKETTYLRCYQNKRFIKTLLFHSILFHSILGDERFHSILFRSILFHFRIFDLILSILFRSPGGNNV